MSSAAAINRPLPVPAPPAAIFDGPGPYASVYLATAGAHPDAADQTARRWRNQRRELAAGGIAEAVLAAIDPLTEQAHMFGETLVVIADATGVRYHAYLPDPPESDLAVAGPLPRLVPLLAATQRLLPYLVVVTDRIGAELIMVRPDQGDLHTEVSGEELHITRSAPGGWSQRRFQQRAENRWEANAGEVAQTVTRLVDAHAPRLVVVSGDVRAVQFLRDQLPGRVTELLTEVQGDYQDLDDALRRAAELVSARAAEDVRAVIEAYDRERGQADLAVTGPEATLTALAAAQVEAVLLDPARLAGVDAWFGPDANQVAVAAQPLRVAGVPDPRSAPLTDVLVRAAFGTAAMVWVTPTEPHRFDGTGVGALLRYR